LSVFCPGSATPGLIVESSVLDIIRFSERHNSPLPLRNEWLRCRVVRRLSFFNRVFAIHSAVKSCTRFSFMPWFLVHDAIARPACNTLEQWQILAPLVHLPRTTSLIPTPHKIVFAIEPRSCSHGIVPSEHFWIGVSLHIEVLHYFIAFQTLDLVPASISESRFYPLFDTIFTCRVYMIARLSQWDVREILRWQIQRA
jgi:hypothetical protein